MSKKRRTQELLFEQCATRGNYDFDNETVKEICAKTGLRNPFDVTKVDHSRLLPDNIKQAGYCIVHLGQGRHRFVKAIDDWYHQFEPIVDNERRVLNYQPSVLNHTDDSESNIISLAFNQGILQEFLYEDDRVGNPRIYMSRRTRISLSYSIGNVLTEVSELQMEMDATFEKSGKVVVVEGKNGFPKDFAVYQLFHPFLDYHQKNILDVKKIECCYLLKKNNVVRLYLYEFEDPADIASLSLVRKAEYTLREIES